MLWTFHQKQPVIYPSHGFPLGAVRVPPFSKDERTTCLPAQAIVVKDCLDDCNVCEKALQRSIDVDLDRKELENELLKRQIDLLEESQEYRCCPAGEEEVIDTD